MNQKHSLDSPGAIQARLRYLKDRKVLLDELTACIERYLASAARPAASRPAKTHQRNSRTVRGAV